MVVSVTGGKGIDTIRNNLHQRDSAGGTVWRESTRGKTEVVWTCTEESCWVRWEKDADDGAARKEETGKA